MSHPPSITLGGGCFWCVEAALLAVDGVTDTTVGYAGGDTPNPTYEEVCQGGTGHAEVVQVTYDPDALSLVALLEIFFDIHDPTTKDREGPDVGSQYRSAIYYHEDDQQDAIESVFADLDTEDPVVTEVAPLSTFYPASEYHQRYVEKNPGDAYCRAHALPKVEYVKERMESD